MTGVAAGLVGGLVSGNVQGLMGLASGDIVSQLPAGAVGIWIADAYKASPKPYIPNLVAGTPAPTTNILNLPRRMFGVGTGWSRGNLTVADLAAVGPDGNTWASTLVTTVGGSDWSLTTNINLPAATYTLGIDIQSNNGAGQSLRQGLLAGMATQNITTSWASYANTFVAPGGAIDLYFARSPDGTTAGSLRVDNARLYPGAVDLGASALDSHAYIGKNAYDTSPTVAAGIFNPGNFAGVIQFAAALAPANVTLMVIARQARGSSTIAAGMSSYNPNSRLVQWIENGPFSASFNGASTGPQNGEIQYDALSQFNGKGWFAHTMQYDGASMIYWLDDYEIINSARSVGAPTLTDFFLAGVANGATQFANDADVAAAVLWTRALTPSEVRAAYALLTARVQARSSLSMTTMRLVCFEGDSIMNGGFGGANGGFAKLSAANLNPIAYGYNMAVGGSTLNYLSNTMFLRVSGTPYVNKIPPANANGRKAILAIEVGHNDQNQGITTASFLADLATYYSAAKSAGWTHVLYCKTIPTIGNVGLELWRQTVHAALVIGTHCDVIVDFDSVTGVGANFTGVLSGGNLTASAVTTGNNIATGQTLVGSGVNASTTITGQSSGTTGGAGVYTTSGAQTLGSVAMASVPWAAANTTDGVHPNNAGNIALEPVLTAAINAI